VVVLPPPLPAPRPTITTAAQVHSSPPAVVHPQQPSAFPSPVQPVTRAPVIYSATHGAVINAAAEYEEQETVAMTAEGLDSFQPSPAARPSTGHGMSTTAVALVGARPPPPTSTVAVQPGRTDLHHNYYSFYNFRQMKSLNNFVGKIKFYQCFNTILYKARNAGSKLVCIHLLKFVCRLCPHCYM